MRARAIVTVIFALFGLAALPACGAGWQTVAPASAQGPVAQACGAAGCFSLGCPDGAALAYRLSLASGRLGTGAKDSPVDVAVSVDGRAAGLVSFDPAGTRPWRAPYHPGEDDALIARLRGGNRAELALPGGDRLALSLAGSSAAIGKVLAACPMPPAAAADPARKVLGEITAACSRYGGTVSVGPGFRRVEDLNGDGKPDLVLDHAAAACSKRASLSCETGGCIVSFWLRRGSDYLGIYRGPIRDYSVRRGAMLTLELDGSACGTFAFEPCEKRFDLSRGVSLAAVVFGPAALAAADATPLAVAVATTPVDAPDATIAARPAVVVSDAAEVNDNAAVASAATGAEAGEAAPEAAAPRPAPAKAAPASASESVHLIAARGTGSKTADAPDKAPPPEGPADSQKAPARTTPPEGIAKLAATAPALPGLPRPGAESAAAPPTRIAARVPPLPTLPALPSAPALPSFTPAARLEWIGDGGPAAPW